MIRISCFLLAVATLGHCELLMKCPTDNSKQYVAREDSGKDNFYCATIANCNDTSLKTYRSSCEQKTDCGESIKFDSDTAKIVGFQLDGASVAAGALDETKIANLAKTLGAADEEIEFLKSATTIACQTLLQLLLFNFDQINGDEQVVVGGIPTSFLSLPEIKNSTGEVASAPASCAFPTEMPAENYTSPGDIDTWKDTTVTQGGIYCASAVTAWEMCQDCVQSKLESPFCSDIFSTANTTHTNLYCGVSACNGGAEEPEDYEETCAASSDPNECYTSVTSESDISVNFSERDIVVYLITNVTVDDLIKQKAAELAELEQKTLKQISPRSCMSWLQVLVEKEELVDQAFYVPESKEFQEACLIVSVSSAEVETVEVPDLTNVTGIQAMGVYCGAALAEFNTTTPTPPETTVSDSAVALSSAFAAALSAAFGLVL